jgi:hypothetical protein
MKSMLHCVRADSASVTLVTPRDTPRTTVNCSSDPNELEAMLQVVCFCEMRYQNRCCEGNVCQTTDGFCEQ